MSASYELQFDSKPYGFRIVGDDHNRNAIVKAILNPILAKSLYVGSWITQINDVVVETWEFSKIITVLRDASLPVMIKFRQCLILCGTDEQLQSHHFTPHLSIEVSDTGKEPSQQKQGKPFVAYNLLVSDISNNVPLKWQLWKRYNQFEMLHKQLLRIVPDLPARLPPKQHFGRFKPGFIQQRRVQLQKYIDDIKHHPGIMSFNPTPSKQSNFRYKDPSEMKPILMEVRDRLETLCDSIEMNTVDRENILSSVRYLLSIVSDTCDRTKDPMDATTVSRNFVTGLPNNNAFIKAADEVFYGKYLLDNSSAISLNDDGNNDENANIDNEKHDKSNEANHSHNHNHTEDSNSEYSFLDWGLLLIDADDYTKLVDELVLRCSDPEMPANLLRFLSQTIYSCVTSEHQKVFHLDSDQFALLTPIDATDDLQRLAGTLLTRIRATAMPVLLDKHEVANEADPLQNGEEMESKQENPDLVESNESKKGKKKKARIVYDDDNNSADVFMTASIGVSVLKSEKLQSLKEEKEKKSKKKKDNNSGNGNGGDGNDEKLDILDKSPADWIQRADLSLQRAKKKGKNCVGPLLEHQDRPQDFRNDVTSRWFEAAAKGEHSKILEMVKTGFSVDTLQISYDSDTKLTALMTAAIYDHSEVARTLLRYNADINLQDEYGRTALIHAAQNGSIKTAKVLLESGKIDINEGDKTQKTSLMYAALQKHTKIVTLLLGRDANVNKQDSQGMTALMLAIQSESLKTVNIILDAHPDLTLQDEFGQTCLIFAAKKDYHNACARMIQNGAQINSQNSNGLNSLMWASFLGHLAVVNTLLQYNADTNLATQHGSSALSFAAESGHCHIVSNLIKAKADINHADHDGDTPLHCAAYSGQLDAVKVLHYYKAKTDISNKENKTALDYAVERGHSSIAEYLRPLIEVIHTARLPVPDTEDTMDANDRRRQQQEIEINVEVPVQSETDFELNQDNR